LFDDKVVVKRQEKVMSGEVDPSMLESSSAFTKAGNIVLGIVQETVQQQGKENLLELMEVNKKVKASLKG
jgi:hypothetical protein